MLIFLSGPSTSEWSQFNVSRILSPFFWQLVVCLEIWGHVRPLVTSLHLLNTSDALHSSFQLCLQTNSYTYLYAFVTQTTIQLNKCSSIISSILPKKLAWACEKKLVQKNLTSLFGYSITQLVWEVKNHAYLDANKGTVVRSQPSVRCAHKDNEKGTQRIHLVSGPWVEHSCGLRAKN